jgi:DNA-binding transcriptional MerR regulator/effector-binding domain-containing protein
MIRGKAKYSIGEVSEITGISIKSLRYYDKRNVLTPSLRDKSSHYRNYSEDQLLEALTIREMKIRGFSIDEMKEVMTSRSLTQIEENLDKKVNSLQKEIEDLKKKMLLVKNSRDLILRAIPALGDDPEEYQKSYSISYLPKTLGVYTRYRSRIYVKEVFWDRFAEVYKICDQNNYVVCGPFMAIFHEHYTHQFLFEDGDLEIILPVLDADLSKPNIKEVGGFTVASCYHVGHYSEMLPEYVDLIKWIEKNNYVITGNPMEEYLVEFTHGASSDKYVTRISFPVETLP